MREGRNHHKSTAERKPMLRPRTLLLQGAGVCFNAVITDGTLKRKIELRCVVTEKDVSTGER